MFFVCSILKHQLNTDTLDENGTCISNAVSLYYKKIIKKTLNPTRFTCHRVIFHYWTIDYFHCYFNQMTKPLRHSSFTLSIEKD